MANANMRFDLNISMTIPFKSLQKRTEIKNINSIYVIDSLIAQEISIIIFQSRNLFVTKALNKDNVIILVRIKGNEYDYKQFHEPDILPIKLWYSYVKLFSVLNNSMFSILCFGVQSMFDDKQFKHFI